MGKTDKPKLTRREQAVKEEQEFRAQVEARCAQVDVDMAADAIFRGGEISPSWPDGWEWIVPLHDALGKLTAKEIEREAVDRRISQLRSCVSTFLRYAETGESWFGKKDESGRYFPVPKSQEVENESVS